MPGRCRRYRVDQRHSSLELEHRYLTKANSWPGWRHAHRRGARFNRFYTRRIGVCAPGLLGSPYRLTRHACCTSWRRAGRHGSALGRPPSTSASQPAAAGLKRRGLVREGVRRTTAGKASDPHRQGPPGVSPCSIPLARRDGCDAGLCPSMTRAPGRGNENSGGLEQQRKKKRGETPCAHLVPATCWVVTGTARCTRGIRRDERFERWWLRSSPGSQAL